MRKLIDVPDSILKDLKKLAVDSELPLKLFIEKLCIAAVKKGKIKK